MRLTGLHNLWNRLSNRSNDSPESQSPAGCHQISPCLTPFASGDASPQVYVRTALPYYNARQTVNR